VVLMEMKAGPQVSLGRLFADPEEKLLELMHGDLRRTQPVGGIVIYDPLDVPHVPRHALVLGVGLCESHEIASVLTRLGQHRAAGLIIRDPVSDDPAVLAAVESSGVALLGLTRGTSWSELSAILRLGLADDMGSALDAQTLGGVPSGDLFALANAISALIDAPISIEDRNSRVLAFSSCQDEIDPSQVEAMVSQRVPRATNERFVERGAFAAPCRNKASILVDPEPRESHELPRVSVAIRAGDEVLGSILAGVHEPLSDERNMVLCVAAKLAAVHMLRIRSGSDVELRLRTDLLRTALHGGEGAYEALCRLGLSEQAVVVFALAVQDTTDRFGSLGGSATLANERLRISDGFAMHVDAVDSRSTCALIGDVVYGLVPISLAKGDAEERAARIATAFLNRIGDQNLAVIAVGPVAHDPGELKYSRMTADRVLRVLRAGQGRGRRVARLADVHADALILELRDIAIARGDRPTGPLARLLEYDRKHKSKFVETLRAWLDTCGDISEASARIYVHPNTFRYRLRRLAEIGELTLSDGEARFSAMLQLRAVHGHSGSLTEFGG
jgi:hypothetical protein